MHDFNPIKPILGSLGSSLGSAASGALDSAMERIWTFAITLLSGAFGVIAQLARPDLDPTSGVFASVLPTLLWCGGLTLFVLALIQIARSVMTGGRGFGTLLIGLGQYLVVTAGGLGFLSVLIVAADGLAEGILSAGLGVTSWRGINDQNSAWLNSAHTVGGVGLGLTALFLVIPAAIGLLIEAMVRYAAILVLAATIPILAAGLVNESTTKWFWTGLRWVMALLLLTPATALVIVIGMRSAAAAAGADGQHSTTGSATVQLVVGGVIMLIALLCPMALFKLLAFLEPNTGAGMQMRGYLSGSGAHRGGSAAASTGDDGGDAETEQRFAAIGGGPLVTGALGAGQGMAASSSATGGSLLDSVGAGHSGSNTAPGSRPSGRSPRDGRANAPQSETAPPESDVTGPAPSPTPPGSGTAVAPSSPSAAGTGGASVGEAGAATAAGEAVTVAAL